MSTNIFLNQRKHNRDTCGTNVKAQDPPNRPLHKRNLVHPSHNYETSLSGHTTPITPSTQIKQVSSHISPVKEIDIR
jgi:hypothetical protein